MSTYVPPVSSISAAAGAGGDTWTMFSRKSNRAPRSEFSSEAASAFGRRHGAEWSGGGASRGGSRFDAAATAAFGSGRPENNAFDSARTHTDTNIFDDRASNAFGKRQSKHMSPAYNEPAAPKEVIHRPNSLGAHLAGLIEIESKPEWTGSALRQKKPTLATPPQNSICMEEMFPSLGSSSPKKSSTSLPSLRGSKGGSFADLVKKRVEEETAEADRKQRELAAKRRNVPDTQTILLSRIRQNHTHTNQYASEYKYESDEDVDVDENDLDYVPPHEAHLYRKENHYSQHPTDESECPFEEDADDFEEAN